MHKSVRSLIVAAGLSVALGVVAADAQGRGKGAGSNGGRALGAETFQGGNPPGFRQGRKVGWVNGHPRGWNKGRKTGWKGGNVPPGLQGR